MDDNLELVECKYCKVTNVFCRDRIKIEKCTYCENFLIDSVYIKYSDKYSQLELNLGHSLLGGY